MPIAPIKIPQNVHIEDRIVGPLTLRQIILVCIGCGFSYAIWASISKAYGYVGVPLTIMVWIPGAISVMFAFVKVNDLTLFRICLLMLERYNKPALRIWEPRTGISINIRTFSVPKQNNNEMVLAKKPERLEELSTMLDAFPTHHEATEPVVAPTQTTEAKQKEATAPAIESEEEPVSALPVRPVQQGRITATPLPDGGSTLDGLEPRSSVSIFTQS